MQELIKIEKRNGIETVNARDLHGFLKSAERFSKWFARMLEYGFVDGSDYTPYIDVHPQNKQKLETFYISLDMAVRNWVKKLAV